MVRDTGGSDIDVIIRGDGGKETRDSSRPKEIQTEHQEDFDFREDIRDYFTPKKREVMKNGGLDMVNTMSYYNQLQSSLEKLEEGESSSKVGIYAEALADIAGTMTFLDTDRPGSLELPSDINPEQEKTQVLSTRLFQEGCRRIYGEYETVSAVAIPSKFKALQRKIEKISSSVLEPMRELFSSEIAYMEGQYAGRLPEFMREQPSLFLQQFDHAYFQMAERVSNVTYNVGQERRKGNMKTVDYEQFKIDLDTVVETLYRLSSFHEVLKEEEKKRATKMAQEGEIEKVRMQAQARAEKQGKSESFLSDAKKRAGQELVALGRFFTHSFRVDQMDFSGNEIQKWQELATGLQSIRSAYLADRRNPWEKNNEYIERVNRFLEEKKQKFSKE